MRYFLILLFVSIQAFCQDISVMSYNIRLGSADDGENSWHYRKEKVFELLNYYEADFIGLQEVQQFQLDEIIANTTDYAFIGVPREEGEWAEYSCILYNKNKYKLVEQNTIWLSETPEKISKGWDAACHRIVTYGKFKSLATKQKLWILNTHFDHVGVTARDNSAKMLLDLGEKLNQKDNLPCILTGDFNAVATEHSMQQLKQKYFDSYDTSSLKPYGPKGTWNAFRFNEVVTKRIDYVLYYTNGLIFPYRTTIIDDSYDGKYPSDHLPVLVVFNYRRETNSSKR